MQDIRMTSAFLTQMSVESPGVLAGCAKAGLCILWCVSFSLCCFCLGLSRFLSDSEDVLASVGGDGHAFVWRIVQDESDLNQERLLSVKFEDSQGIGLAISPRRQGVDVMSVLES